MHAIELWAPNVDYGDFEGLIEQCLYQYNQWLDQGIRVVFMGSSMGGFASDYLSMKTGSPAIMINPVLRPSELLTRFVGINANAETGEPYAWQLPDCEQYHAYEAELRQSNRSRILLVLLDDGDQLLDAQITSKHYQVMAEVISFAGGSHAFEHMREALPAIQQVLDADSSRWD